MAENTKIEWTDATWNPITGCTMVSAGCSNCYAMGLAATRLRHHPSREGLTRMTSGRAVWTGEVRFNEQWLDQPLRWRRPRMIFVCAHGDMFHENVPDEWIDRVFAVMALAPQHTFQVLTKRPERARVYMAALYAGDRHVANAAVEMRGSVFGAVAANDAFKTGYSNVWLGTSIEDQATADARIPHLLTTPAAVRFVSAEPLLGPVDLTHSLTRWCVRCAPFEQPCRIGCENRTGLDWVIVGGESGPGARPMHPDWARSLRDQCTAACVAFLFKQWGEWAPWDDDNWSLDTVEDVEAHERAWEIAGVEFLKVGKKRAGRLLDGRTWDQFPDAGNMVTP